MRSDPEAIAHHPFWTCSDCVAERHDFARCKSGQDVDMFFSQWLGSFIEEKVSNKLAWDFMRIFVGVSCQFTAWAFWDLHRHIAAFWKKQRLLDMISAGKLWALMGITRFIWYVWMMMSDICACVWCDNDLILFDTCWVPLIGVIASMILGCSKLRKTIASAARQSRWSHAVGALWQLERQARSMLFMWKISKQQCWRLPIRKKRSISTWN